MRAARRGAAGERQAPAGRGSTARQARGEGARAHQSCWCCARCPAWRQQSCSHTFHCRAECRGGTAALNRLPLCRARASRVARTQACKRVLQRRRQEPVHAACVAHLIQGASPSFTHVSPVRFHACAEGRGRGSSGGGGGGRARGTAAQAPAVSSAEGGTAAQQPELSCRCRRVRRGRTHAPAGLLALARCTPANGAPPCAGLLSPAC